MEETEREDLKLLTEVGNDVKWIKRAIEETNQHLIILNGTVKENCENITRHSIHITWLWRVIGIIIGLSGGGYGVWQAFFR